MEDKKIDVEDLAYVTGGYADEFPAIIEVFRKHGFEKEAKALEKGGVFFFGDSLKKVLKSLGYTHDITIYTNDDRPNINSYNGTWIQHRQLIDILDDFLYRKANNIEWWQ